MQPCLIRRVARLALPAVVFAASVALSSVPSSAESAAGEASRPPRALLSLPLLKSLAQPGVAHVHAWVYFKDRGLASPEDRAAALARAEQALPAHTLWRRSKTMGARVTDETDIPVSDRYADAVKATGATRRAVSRYLNAMSVEATPAQLDRIAALGCVDHLDLVHGYKRSEVEPTGFETASEQFAFPEIASAPRGRAAPQAAQLDTTLYGVSYKQLKQIHVTDMHAAGYHGEGVLICFLDAGFQTRHSAFSYPGHPIQIAAQRDFIQGDTVVANEAGKDSTGQDSHGTYTLSSIGAYYPGRYLGAAYEARFILGKTEWVPSESPVEEDYWLMGSEWADSLGADIISSSLGYREFDGPYISLTYADLDGHHAPVTHAAEIAAAHGILVVNAMGNEGQSPYPGSKLIAPADADSIISSGAVDSLGVVAAFSSQGPTYDRRIKPDIMARGLLAWAVSYSNNSNYTRVSGTSFSTPLTAGAAALLLQKYPWLTPLDAINAIHQSGDRSSNPDTIYGWGLLNISGAAAVIAATGVDSGGSNHGLPGLSLGLGSNIPNPFRGATTIHFSLNGVADNRNTRLRIFDVSGRLVTTLHDGPTSPGQHAATWDGTRSDGRRVGNGIYFYRLDSGTQSVARRMILVR